MNFSGKTMQPTKSIYSSNERGKSKVFFRPKMFSTFSNFPADFPAFLKKSFLNLRLGLNIFFKLLRMLKCFLVLLFSIEFLTFSPKKPYFDFRKCDHHSKFSSKICTLLYGSFFRQNIFLVFLC